MLRFKQAAQTQVKIIQWSQFPLKFATFLKFCIINLSLVKVLRQKRLRCKVQNFYALHVSEDEESFVLCSWIRLSTFVTPTDTIIRINTNTSHHSAHINSQSCVTTAYSLVIHQIPGNISTIYYKPANHRKFGLLNFLHILQVIVFNESLT